MTLGNNFYIVQSWKGTGHCARSVALRETCRGRNCSLSLAGPKAELMSSLLQTILGYISLFLDDFDVFRFFFFFEDPK